LGETTVYDKLDVRVFGSGDVVFRGNPFVLFSITRWRLINAS